VIEVLEYAKEAKIKCAVATSSTTTAGEKKIADAGIRDYFLTITCGDQVEISKPHPEIYRKAGASVNADMAKSIGLEDSENGVKSATAAGLNVIQIPNLVPPSEELLKLGHRIPLKYCAECGHQTTTKIPEGDNRERQVCDSCNTIHYQNPNNVCGCILEWQGKVLLCKRAIEPRYGYWTLPAGFMENKETTMEGAAREAFEEANATAVNLKLFGMYNLPRINHKVHVADIRGRPGADIEVTRY